MSTTITPRQRPLIWGLFFHLVLALSPFLSFAQTPGDAPVINPTGGFSIRGEVSRNSSPGDWRGNGAAGTYVLNISGTAPNITVTPANSSTTAFVRDAYNTTADQIFTGGSKFDDGITALRWSTGKATAKNDIHNGMFHISFSSDNDGNDRWMIMGGDRLSTEGTSYIDFEFAQRPINVNSNGTFSYGTVPNTVPALQNGKTPGDFVISIEYSNGGSTPKLRLYVWEQSGNKYTYVEKNISNFGTLAQTNTSTVPVDYYAFGSGTYEPYAFVEAAVKISALYELINENSSDCSGAVYRSMFIKTKASDALTAALKDFVEPQNIELTFGGTTIEYSDPDACSSETISAPTITGAGGGTFSYAVLSGGSTLNLNTTTGAISAGSDPGEYKVIYTYSDGGCSGTAEDFITIYANPAITPGSIGDICQGTTSISIPYSSPTGSPNKYSINFDDAAITDITDADLTASPLSVTVPNSLGAGTYTGKLKVKNSNGCESEEYNISFDVNVGSPFELQAPAGPVCPGSPVTFTGPSNASYTYVWSGGNESTTNTANYTAGNCGTQVTATLTITDGNGCQASDEASVDVNDTEPPVFTNPPGNVVIEAGADLPTDKPSVSDNCADLDADDIDVDDVTDNNNCNQVIKRTFTATDDCGNSVSYTQLIVVRDRTAPVIDCSDAELTLDCGAPIPTPDVNDATAELYYTDVVTGQTAGCSSYNVIRTWTAVDASGNYSTCVQTITYNAPPVETSLAQQQTAVMENKTKTTAPTTAMKKALQIKAFPNPFNNVVNFTFVPNTTGYAVLELVDLNGRYIGTVYKGNVTVGQSKTVSYEYKQATKTPLVYRLTIGNDVKTGKLLPVIY